MKKVFTESLDNKLLRYSLVAGTVLLGVKEADAQVWGATEGRTISTPGDTLQINFNGVVAFSIKYSTKPISYHSYSIFNQTSKAQWIKRSGGRAKGIKTSTNYIIKSSAPLGWSNAINRFERFFYGSYTAVSFSNTSYDEFIAVRFKISGNYHLGWIKIKLLKGGSGITVISYAYNQSAGQPISANGTLPVELTTFTADNLGGNIELKWNTATEVNNYGFDIERSQKTEVSAEGGCASGASSQNPQWLKIGFVKGNGNSNSPKNYSFIDDNPPSGNFEYRLKQIDNDGSFRYSNIVEASFMKPNKFELFQNYPNPFNPTTTIQYAIPKSEHVTIKVYDELGKEVSSLVNENKEAGQYRVNFNGSNLASGIYYYRIAAGDFSEVKKLMLLK